MTNPTAVDKLRERLERAIAAGAQRPWSVVEYGDGDSLVIHDARRDWRVCFMATPSKDSDFERIEANANLIVAAVNGLPALLAELARLEARVAELEGVARWYGEQIAGSRKIGSMGEQYRDALDADGGRRARAALATADAARDGGA